MGLTDTAADIARDVYQEVKSLLNAVTTLTERIDRVKDSVDVVRNDQDKFIDRAHTDLRNVAMDITELHRRVSQIEARFDSIIETSMREAILQIAKDRIETDMDSDTINRLIAGKTAILGAPPDKNKNQS